MKKYKINHVFPSGRNLSIVRGFLLGFYGSGVETHVSPSVCGDYTIVEVPEPTPDTFLAKLSGERYIEEEFLEIRVFLEAGRRYEID